MENYLAGIPTSKRKYSVEYLCYQQRMKEQKSRLAVQGYNYLMKQYLVPDRTAV